MVLFGNVEHAVKFCEASWLVKKHCGFSEKQKVLSSKVSVASLEEIWLIPQNEVRVASLVDDSTVVLGKA